MNSNWILVIFFSIGIIASRASYENFRLVVDETPWILHESLPVGTNITHVKLDTKPETVANYKLEFSHSKMDFKMPFVIDANGTVTLTSSLREMANETFTVDVVGSTNDEGFSYSVEVQIV